MRGEDYFKNTPAEVIELHMMSFLKAPVGLSQWLETVLNNPAYFPDDYDHIVKYSAIPEEVHQAYWEYLQFRLKPFDDALPTMTPSKGVLYMIDHPEEKALWDKEWNLHWERKEEQKEARTRIYQAAHRKYYAEYGIKFNPNIAH